MKAKDVRPRFTQARSDRFPRVSTRRRVLGREHFLHTARSELCLRSSFDCLTCFLIVSVLQNPSYFRRVVDIGNHGSITYVVCRASAECHTDRACCAPHTESQFMEDMQRRSNCASHLLLYPSPCPLKPTLHDVVLPSSQRKRVGTAEEALHEARQVRPYCTCHGLKVPNSIHLHSDGSGSIDREEFLQIPQIANNPLASRLIAIFDEECVFAEYIQSQPRVYPSRQWWRNSRLPGVRWWSERVQ